MAFWLALAGAATAAWHDCSAAEGIANPQLTFQNARRFPLLFPSLPPAAFLRFFFRPKCSGWRK